MIPNVLTRKETMNRMLKDPDFPALKDGVWFIFGDRLEEYLMERKKKK